MFQPTMINCDTVPPFPASVVSNVIQEIYFVFSRPESLRHWTGRMAGSKNLSVIE